MLQNKVKIRLSIKFGSKIKKERKREKKSIYLFDEKRRGGPTAEGVQGEGLLVSGQFVNQVDRLEWVGRGRTQKEEPED